MYGVLEFTKNNNFGRSFSNYICIYNILALFIVRSGVQNVPASDHFLF